MTAPNYGPIDKAVKGWLATTELLAPLLRRPDGSTAVYLAMPKSAPMPVVLVNLTSGGPLPRADLPLTRYRISFDCIAKTRDDASAISRALITELEWLGDTPGVLAEGVYLGGADISLYRWQPDPDSDTPRYIVDALITTVH